MGYDQTGLIFLDIDGVLNDNNWNKESGSYTINKECVWCFNQIIEATRPRIVLSSEWRHMLYINYSLGNNIKLFTYLLRTHGISKDINIIGLTLSDDECPSRPNQISRYIIDHSIKGNIVILDDDDLGWKSYNLEDHWYQTQRYKGLQTKDIKPIIDKLIK